MLQQSVSYGIRMLIFTKVKQLPQTIMAIAKRVCDNCRNGLRQLPKHEKKTFLHHKDMSPYPM